MARRFRIGWEEPDVSQRLLDEVGTFSRPLHGWEDLDPLIDRIGDARVVPLGEASHGTAEYYEWRERITARPAANFVQPLDKAAWTPTMRT